MHIITYIPQYNLYCGIYVPYNYIYMFTLKSLQYAYTPSWNRSYVTCFKKTQFHKIGLLAYTYYHTMTFPNHVCYYTAFAFTEGLCNST